MKKILLITTALSLLSFSAHSKEVLYAINSGSLTGSHSVMTAAWANDLSSDYDIKTIHAKGCAKLTTVLEKLKGKHAIYNHSSNWYTKKECDHLAPTEDTLLYSDLVNGVVFTNNSNNDSLLINGTSVAYTNDISLKWLTDIENHNNISLKKVRYEGSQELVVAVLNGEVDFSITVSPKHFYEKLDQLKAVYNLSAGEVEGIPSIHTIGAKSYTKVASIVYSGNDRDSVRENMVKSYNDGSSAMFNYHDVSKGTISYINKPLEANWELVSSNR